MTAVRVILPWQLRDLTGGLGSLAIEGPPRTVGDALQAMGDRYPGVYERICSAPT